MEIIRTTCWFFITISATVAPSGLPVGVTDASTINNKQQIQRTSNDGGGGGGGVNQQTLDTFNSRSINSLDNIDPNFPRFSDPVPNITVSIGKDALLTCAVENLKGYKVAWVRVDTQTILSIHHNVITQNPRISLSYNDHKSWYLHIKEVEETDRGWYMCQINTDPMRSLKGYLQVVVPPAIIDSQTSSDMVVREGTNVTLTCKAGGYPEPYVMWRREDGGEMAVGGEHVNVVDGEILVISKVSRLHMAAYLCVASNGVPPSVSKRVMLRVQFPPMLSIPNQLEAAYLGQDVTLECHTEAYPTSINYWTTGRGDMIISGDKYETHSTTEDYSKFMRLTIHKVGPGDFGIFRCMAKNSLGETHGLITLDEIPAPFVEHTTEAFYLNQVKGKRPPKKSMSNTIDDYGVEEWKDDYSADYTSPSRGSTHNVRLPPGAFHKNSATLSTICVFQQTFLQISLLIFLCIYSLSIQDIAIRHRLGIIIDRM